MIDDNAADGKSGGHWAGYLLFDVFTKLILVYYPSHTAPHTPPGDSDTP